MVLATLYNPSNMKNLPCGEPYINQRTSDYSERFTFTGKGPRKGWRTPLSKVKYREQRDEEKERSRGPFASERGDEPRSGIPYCSVYSYTYFGARYMDHELTTMWLSVDPMADKHPSISPYAYCAWNPIKLVDPDGKESMETDIVNKKTGACKHIEDGKNQIILLSDQAYNTIEMMGQDSYTSMSESQQKEYNSLLNSGEAVSLNSKLGKTIRAVYAEMGSISCSEQDRNIVASSIATRLKTEPNIDKVLNPKQYNATGTEVYKIGPYEKEKQILQKNPYYYKAHSKAIMQTRLQVISASYKALCGLLSPEYNNIHSFVSPPLSSTHFDSNKNLSNVTSLFSNLKGASGVWRLK